MARLQIAFGRILVSVAMLAAGLGLGWGMFELAMNTSPLDSLCRAAAIILGMCASYSLCVGSLGHLFHRGSRFVFLAWIVVLSLFVLVAICLPPIRT